MVYTRSHARQGQQSTQPPHPPHSPQPPQSPHTQHTQHTQHTPHHNISFIDASIEWRKNKIKKENCTFEYI